LELFAILYNMCIFIFYLLLWFGIIYKYVSFHSRLNHSYIIYISVHGGTRSWIN
jgi:hypothetical protein